MLILLSLFAFVRLMTSLEFLLSTVFIHNVVKIKVFSVFGHTRYIGNICDDVMHTNEPRSFGSETIKIIYI